MGLWAGDGSERSEELETALQVIPDAVCAGWLSLIAL